MIERVFCIDFGSAYTKVALRSAARENSELIPCGDAAVEFWAPTVVAVDWSKSEARLEFGYKAAGIKPGGRISVFTDIKKDLFAPAPPDVPERPPLDALLQSDEFDALAAKYGVLPPEIAALRNLVGSARALGGTRADRGPASEARRQSNAKALAAHYLKWLRERVLDACYKQPDSALKYEDIPVRIAVPVLNGAPELAQEPGVQRLREALNTTGWKLDERLFVAEPEANAVGILTKGANALNQRNKKINLGEMFSKGPLVTVLKGDQHHPTYRAVVIDVGAFTTDFAALTVDTGGKTPDVSGGAGFTVLQRSVRLGVKDLDATVGAALSEEKRLALGGLALKDFATFQENAYTEGIGYRLVDKRVIGGEADRSAIQGCLTDFSKRLADETAAFCRELAPVSMQELILTGGGSMIPTVRDTLLSAAQLPGSAVVKTHAPNIRKAQLGTPVDNLNDRFARGASALGGASIYFEQNCY
jgi:hypothetical protein